MEIGPSDRSLTPVGATNGDIIKDKAGILSIWTEHFSELLNKVSPTDHSFIHATPQLSIIEELDLPPTSTEVKMSISSLTSHESPNIDGLRGKVLKYGGNRLHEEIFNYKKMCWDAAEAPSQWKDAKIAAIYKRKDDNAECGNSKGISLLYIERKVYARLLLLRIIDHVLESVLSESQCGFHKYRSTTDIKFVLRHMQENCREQHKELIAVIVDLCKAIDAMNREILWQVLARFGCPARFVQAIEEFHIGMYTSVSEAGDVLEPFQVFAGVEQDCVLAPVIFNLFIVVVLYIFLTNTDKELTGIPVRYRYDGGGLLHLARLKSYSKFTSVTVGDVQYTDDAAFLSHTAS